jgi:hypothetical protein
MTEPIDPKRRKVPLRAFLNDFRSTLRDQELKEKYDLSARAYVSLVKALLANQVITPADLARRKEVAVQRDLVKESQFLAGLFICPNCSHPHPQPFAKCPACGANPDDFRPPSEVIDSFASTSGQISVEEDETDLEVEVEEEVKGVRQVLDAHPGKSPVSDEKSKPEAKGKTSALRSVRSFFGTKFKKK